MIIKIIIALFILWLFGFGFGFGGNLIHSLLVVVLILAIIRLLSK